MFRRNDEDYLISQIPRFELSLANIRDLSCYDDIIDLREKEDYISDHIIRPGVQLQCGCTTDSPTALVI